MKIHYTSWARLLVFGFAMWYGIKNMDFVAGLFAVLGFYISGFLDSKDK